MCNSGLGLCSSVVYCILCARVEVGLCSCVVYCILCARVQVGLRSCVTVCTGAGGFMQLCYMLYTVSVCTAGGGYTQLCYILYCTVCYFLGTCIPRMTDLAILFS